MNITIGDYVRHKKNRQLIKGECIDIHPSREYVKVLWRKEDNPSLLWDHWDFYKISYLEGEE